MFQPNLIGKMQRRTGRDVHGRGVYEAPRDCPFAVVNMDIGAIKTSVRADSSASRGSADETAAMRAKILVPPFVSLKPDDIFLFDGMSFLIVSLHNRRSVSGALDHIECTLEVTPV